MLLPKASLDTNSQSYAELDGGQGKMKLRVSLILYQQVCTVPPQLSVHVHTKPWRRSRDILQEMEDKFSEQGAGTSTASQELE